LNKGNGGMKVQVTLTLKTETGNSGDYSGYCLIALIQWFKDYGKAETQILEKEVPVLKNGIWFLVIHACDSSIYFCA